MTTAFQPNAFQKNAFQIFAESGGGDSRRYTRQEKRRVKRLIKTYEEIAEVLPDSKEMISAIDTYENVQTKEQLERRKKAQFISDTLPSADFINWFAMLHHDMALQRFWRIVEKLKLKISESKRRKEEEELILFFMIMEAQ